MTTGKQRCALASKFLLRLPVMSCFIIHPVGNRGAFSHTEKAPDLQPAITVGMSTMGKLSQSLGIEISSPLACRFVSYNSSGWKSRGFFSHGKSSRLTTGDSLGTLTTGKPNQGVGRFGGLLGVSATPATRCVLVIWAGALSRNA